MDERTAFRTNKRLSVLASCLTITAMLIAIFGEQDLLPLGIIPEAYAYFIQAPLLLLSIISIPVALKLMSWQRIRRQLPAHYTKWGIVRLLLLFIPLLLCLAMHYLLLDMSLLYFALILALAILFVWPSRKRMEEESK